MVLFGWSKSSMKTIYNEIEDRSIETEEGLGKYGRTTSTIQNAPALKKVTIKYSIIFTISPVISVKYYYKYIYVYKKREFDRTNF